MESYEELHNRLCKLERYIIQLAKWTDFHSPFENESSQHLSLSPAANFNEETVVTNLDNFVMNSNISSLPPPNQEFGSGWPPIKQEVNEVTEEYNLEVIQEESAEINENVPDNFMMIGEPYATSQFADYLVDPLLDMSMRNKDTSSNSNSQTFTFGDGTAALQELTDKIREHSSTSKSSASDTALQKSKKSYKKRCYCETCDRWFTTTSHLSRHYRTSKHKNKAKAKISTNFVNSENNIIPGANDTTTTSTTQNDLCNSTIADSHTISNAITTTNPQFYEHENGLRNNSHLAGGSGLSLPPDTFYGTFEAGMTSSIECPNIPERSFPTKLVSSASEIGEIKGSLRCSQCPNTFSRGSSLTQHVNSAHSVNKLFKCAHCGKGFSTQDLLETHKQKHSGEKEHKCSQCPKQFHHRSDLNRHFQTTHTEEKIVSCPICKKKFGRRDHLKKHIKNRHKM